MFTQFPARVLKTLESSTRSRLSLATLPVLLLLLITAALFPTTASASTNNATLQKPLPFSGTMITGEAYNPYNGNLYYADYVQGQIVVVAVPNNGVGYNTSVFDSSITEPMAMAADQSGNLYVTDAAGQIYEYAFSTTTYSYSAKQLIASGLHNPTGIAADGGQNLFVTDSTDNKVYYYEYSYSTKTFAARIAIGSGWSKPTAITWNGNFTGERIYVADSTGIQYLVPTSQTTFTQHAFTTSLTNVQSLARDYNDDVYAGDTDGNVTELIPTSSTPQTFVIATHLGVVGALVDWGFFTANNSYSGITAGSSQYGTFSILLNNFNYQSPSIAAPSDYELGVTVQFGQTETLGDPLIEVQGNLFQVSTDEFQLEINGNTCITGHTYNAGQSCLYLLRFFPQNSGLRYGSLTPQDSTDTQIAPAVQFAGMINAGEAAFTPGVEYLTNEMSQQAYGYDQATSIFVNSQNNVLVSANSANTGYLLVGQLYGSFSPLYDYLAPFPIEAATLDSNGDALFSDNTGKLIELALKDTNDSMGFSILTLFTKDADGNAFSYINSIALDQSNNIYFADASPDGTKGTKKVYVSYFAGNNTWLAPIAIGGPYTRPFSVQVDMYGYVYFIDRIDNATALGSIYQLEINGDGGYGSTVLLGHTHTSTGQPNYATSIFVDPNENVYIADEKYATSADGGIYELNLTPYAGTYTELLYWSPPFDNLLPGHLPELISMDTYGDLIFSSGDEYQGVDLLELDAHDVPVLNFATQQNQPAEPQTINLTNFGLGWLQLAIPNSGTNPFIDDYPQYFTIDNSSSTACPHATPGNSASIEYSETCTITIDFDYESNTPLTAPLTLNSTLVIDEYVPVNAQYPALQAIVQPALVSSSTVVLSSSANPVFTENPVTFVAGVVSSGEGTPTGIISFYDGTTLLGTGTLDNTGNTSLTVASLTVGTHSITAQYGGNAWYKPATSSALAELVEDFNLSITSTANPIVGPGETASIPLSISIPTPQTTPAAITLTATGAPDGSSYTFSQPTVAAGTGSTEVTLVINIPINYVVDNKMPMKSGTKLPLAPLALALLVLPLAGRMRKAGKGLTRMLGIALLAVAGMAAMTAINGCGANTAAPYEVTVTASSGNLSHSSTFLITVK